MHAPVADAPPLRAVHGCSTSDRAAPDPSCHLAAGRSGRPCATRPQQRGCGPPCIASDNPAGRNGASIPSEQALQDAWQPGARQATQRAPCNAQRLVAACLLLSLGGLALQPVAATGAVSEQEPSVAWNRAFENASAVLPKDYWSYETLQIPWGNASNYELGAKLGEGEYGVVYAATSRLVPEPCVVKVLKHSNKRKIRREVKVLQTLAGGPGVVRLLDVMWDSGTNRPAFAFPLVRHLPATELYPQLTAAEVQLYMWQLLQALDYAHSHGIMHRDIKPDNVLIDRAAGNLTVIDWGLADFYLPGTEYSYDVATLNYRAPELLLEQPFYAYSIDMWSYGCILASLLLRNHVLLSGGDTPAQLQAIAQVLGARALQSYAGKLGQALDLDPRTPADPARWDALVLEQGRAPPAGPASPEALDLLSRLLRVDPGERLTSREATAHPYFAQYLAQQRSGAPSPQQPQQEGPTTAAGDAATKAAAGQPNSDDSGGGSGRQSTAAGTAPALASWLADTIAAGANGAGAGLSTENAAGTSLPVVFGSGASFSAAGLPGGMGGNGRTAGTLSAARGGAGLASGRASTAAGALLTASGRGSLASGRTTAEGKPVVARRRRLDARRLGRAGLRRA